MSTIVLAVNAQTVVLLLVGAAAVALILWLVRAGSPRLGSAALYRGGVETRPDSTLLHGGRKLRIVGESHYQRALSSICGGKTPAGHETDVECDLVPEPHNAHDANAVAVTVHGRTVGYLSRAWAANYSAVLQELARIGCRVACEGEIRGGWRRPGSEGNFGVCIFLPSLHECRALLDQPEIVPLARSEACEEPSPQSATCSKCGHVEEYPASWRGTTIRCTHCRAEIPRTT